LDATGTFFELLNMKQRIFGPQKRHGDLEIDGALHFFPPQKAGSLGDLRSANRNATSEAYLMASCDVGMDEAYGRVKKVGCHRRMMKV